MGAVSLGRPLAVDRSAGTLTRSLPHAGWPLTVYFGGYVVLWAIGISHFAAPLLVAPMVAWMLMTGRARIPRPLGLYILFLVLMLGSLLMLEERQNLISFSYRAATYIAGGVFVMYAYNLPSGRATTRRLADLLAWFWIVIVVLGILALVLPADGFQSPVEMILPARLRANPFIRELVHPGFAQVQIFLGYPVPRPKAPFVYTNNWGASFALLTPLFIAQWLRASSPRRRLLARLLMVAAILPVVVSLNRGLWISLGIGLLYASVRFAARGQVRSLRTIVVLFLVVGLVAWLSPLRGLLADRFETGHSNDSRLTLYAEVLERIDESPLLGFGAPRDTNEADRNIPPVGTQGQFWMVLFSHGIPAAALFVGWFVLAFWRTRRGATPLQFWTNVSLLIACIQLPFYGMLPTQLMIVMVIAAIALRERRSDTIAADEDDTADAALAPVGT